VALDVVGAGENQLVLVVQGSSARMTDQTKNLPADAVIVGIVDTATFWWEDVLTQRNKP